MLGHRKERREAYERGREEAELNVTTNYDHTETRLGFALQDEYERGRVDRMEELGIEP